MLPASPGAAAHAAPSAPAGRLLMVVPNSPNPIRCRILEVLKELMRYATVDIVCLDDGAPVQLPDGVGRLIVMPNSSRVARGLRVLAGLARGFPVGPEYYHCLGLPQLLAEIDLAQYDAIYVSQLPLHRLHLAHPRIVYDVVDCWSHKSRVMAAGVGGGQRIVYMLDRWLTPRQERAACNAAAVVLVTAEREASALRSIGVTAPIETYLHDRRTFLAPRTLEQRGRLVVSFHGKLSYKPNAMALDLLNRVIVPHLDPRHIEMQVVGQCPSNFAARYPRLRFTGYVESIAEALRAADLSVFPMTISVGFPNKAMESLAAGVPFIATREVVEGLPAMPELFERGIFVRTIAEFAGEIERFRRLPLQERKEMAERCRAQVHSIYNAPARSTQWGRLLGRLPQIAVDAGEPVAAC